MHRQIFSARRQVPVPEAAVHGGRPADDGAQHAAAELGGHQPRLPAAHRGHPGRHASHV